MGSGASNPKKSKYANKEQDKPRHSAPTERTDTLKTVKRVVQSVHEHEETCQPSDLFKAHTIRQAFPSATSTGKKISGAVPEKLCCGACGAFIVDLHGDKEFHACKNCWSFGEVFALCCTCYEGNPKWRGKWPTGPAAAPAASRVERHRSAHSLNSGNTLEPPQPGERRTPSPIGDSSDEEPGLFSQVKTPRTRREMRKKYSRRRSDPASPTGKDAEKEELIRRGSEGNLPRPSTAQGDRRPPPRPPSRTRSRLPSAPALAPTELRPDAVAKKQSIRMPSKQTQAASAAMSRQSSLQSRQEAAAISRQGSLQSRQGPSSRPTSRQGSITSRQGSKNCSGHGSSAGSRSSSRAFGEEEVADALAVKIRSGTWKATIHEGKGHTRSEIRSLTFGADGDVEGTGPFASPIKGQHVLPKVQWTETYSWGSILIAVKHQPWTTPQLWGTFQASDGGSGHIGLDFQE
ncbi:hypothetical protein AK812_SmicGene37618 [Symbiodinium microadriaticum]|uniref:Uncharacterized protein n=1 Tax=Symbiodinium microadriaticum TaxID=2951 RepID=A0A1Q9CFV4_SYMMI|nr:hypothetical protein AK812_SmicGene37618 [Symbiodinium microadriaticum]